MVDQISNLQSLIPTLHHVPFCSFLTAVSTTRYQVPLTFGSKTVGYLILSEGPAVGASVTFIKESQKQIEQLDRLTGSMLNLSRLEARLRGNQFVTDDLRTAVKEAVVGLRPLAAVKQHHVELTLPDDAIPQADGGSGLGLAICREIVGICNGRITLEIQPGQDSIFTITLPND